MLLATLSVTKLGITPQEALNNKGNAPLLHLLEVVTLSCGHRLQNQDRLYEKLVESGRTSLCCEFL